MRDERPSVHRRAAPRRAERYPAGDVRIRTRHLEAELLNLSRLGAAIQTSQQPRIGAALLCELETPQTAALIEGEIRWCSLAGTATDDSGEVRPVYRAGIRFINGSPGNFLRILRTLGLRRRNGDGT